MPFLWDYKENENGSLLQKFLISWVHKGSFISDIHAPRFGERPSTAGVRKKRFDFRDKVEIGIDKIAVYSDAHFFPTLFKL